MNERHNNTSPERRIDTKELERAAGERREALRERVETKAERSGETSREHAHESRERAHELAHEAHEHRAESEPVVAEQAERTPDVNPKAKRDEAFNETMASARAHMSPSARTFSKVIHQPAVERVSEVAGKTVARPNAVLGGSFTAFVVVLAVFLIARHYGYPLSGAETIVAFAGGWVLGIVFDYLRVMITGRHG